LTSSWTKQILRNRYLYLILLPAFIYYIIFAYVPMYGVILAFKEFDFSKGILGSPWIGLRNFTEIFADPDFSRAFQNTVVISLGRLIIEFPIPILTAMLINEIFSKSIKRIFQTIFTFPHFLSWIVINGMMIIFLGSDGMVKHITQAVGIPEINFMSDSSTFRALLFFSDSWKEMGYSSIIYLAAIASINPELYEAAYVDGAGKFRQAVSITWPSIRGTVAILFILAVGNAMNAGFDQIFNMYSPSVYNVSDIIDTYIYRRTFTLGSSFGSSTAIGLFKSVINMALLFAANYLIKRSGEKGLV
jgi:putative aldouronate transport system permease protein